MKTLLIAISVLALSAMVHGYNPTRLQKYYRDLWYCQTDEEMTRDNWKLLSIETLDCVLKRDGEIINQNDSFVMEAALRRIEDFISNRENLREAYEMLRMCYSLVYEEGFPIYKKGIKVTSDTKRRDMIVCSYPLINLVDTVN